MTNPPKARTEEKKVNTDADRYPKFKEGMRRILDESNVPDDEVSRLEVNFLPNGEATYRYWIRKDEDSEGGVLPAT